MAGKGVARFTVPMEINALTATRLNFRLPAVLLLVSIVSLGCVPRGDSSGRIGAYETDDRETRSDRILPVTITEFSDNAAEEIVSELANIEPVQRIAASGRRATIVLGDINNQTRNVPSDEFELMRRRLRSNLIGSELARRQLRFVEQRFRVAEIEQRELGPQPGTDGQTEVLTYPKDTSFALNLDVYRINRGAVNQYYLEATLTSFETGEILLSFATDAKQVKLD